MSAIGLVEPLIAFVVVVDASHFVAKVSNQFDGRFQITETVKVPNTRAVFYVSHPMRTGVPLRIQIYDSALFVSKQVPTCGQSVSHKHTDEMRDTQLSRVQTQLVIVERAIG